MSSKSDYIVIVDAGQANWLCRNRDILLSYWAQRIDSVELCDKNN